jgi:pheromone shutdown-related protein TraB
MIRVGNVSIIGTSHISPVSIMLVKEKILEDKPEFVAIELDQGRLLSLLGKKPKLRVKDILSIGVKGFMFTLIGAWVEQKLGKMVGTKPGGEMKAAIKAASKVKAKVALIDQDIRITLKKLFKKLTWREKGRFLKDLIFGLLGLGPKLEGVRFDLKEVPSDKLIEKMIGLLRDRYPSVYDVLIHGRNVYMTNQIMKLAKKFPEAKIIVVVGAGHVKGMREILENEKT